MVVNYLIFSLPFFRHAHYVDEKHNFTGFFLARAQSACQLSRARTYILAYSWKGLGGAFWSWRNALGRAPFRLRFCVLGI